MGKKATGLQIRAGRGALGWSMERLSEVSGVSMRTIARYEESDDVPASRAGNLERLVQALEDAGIEFIGTPEDAPGIRLHKPPRQR